MAFILKFKEFIKANRILEPIIRFFIRPWLWYGMQKAFFKAWLREKNLVKYNKYQYLKDLKNSHVGERCFIVATGPSLTVNDLNLIKNEYSMSMNSAVLIMDKTDWKPELFAIQDEYVYQRIESSLQNTFKGNLKNRLIISDYVQSFFKSAKNFRGFPVNLLDHKFNHEKTGVIMFSNDCHKIIYDNYSVIFSLMQLAIYMGFNEIYLLGSDCNYNQKKAHFIDHGATDPYALHAGERLIYVHSKFKEFADSNNVKVFNCTRGGMLEVYPRKSLEEVLGL